MKTKYLTLSLVLITLGILGCNKDEVTKPDNNNDLKASIKITQQLLSFREKLKLKSGSSLPTDSATWYLEGVLNFENANNNHQFDGLEFFYDTLVIYNSGSSFTLPELSNAFVYFSNKLELIAQSQTISNFAFNAIDISITPSGLKNGETKIAMVVGAGSNAVGIYTAFGSTDYWVWGFEGGKCGAYAGQGGTSDAAKQLKYKFNHPLALPTPGYYTDIESIVAYGPDFPDVNNPGPYCDYKIFYFDATNTGIWPCLAPDELNYYLSTMPYIINAKRPGTKAFINVDVMALFWLNYTSEYQHWYTLNYGYFQQYD